MDSTFEKLKTIVTAQFSVPAERITPDATLEMIGLDSLDAVEMLFEVEEAFSIRLPQDGGSALRSMKVQDIVDTVDRLIAESATRTEASA